MSLQLIGTIEEHSELTLSREGKKSLAQPLAPLAVVFDQNLRQVRKLDLPVFDPPVELYQRFFNHTDIFRIEMLALVVPRRHGDDQCREQRLLFTREFSGEGVDRYGMVQIDGEILPAKKLAYPFVAATLVDD